MSVDKNHEPGSFWLIGSQIFKLMRGVQESLAGRVAVLSLTSMSQAEIARDADINLDTGKGLA
ncbi:AAA family ATPase [Lachnospira eligens]|jgi:putative GTP-binding protein|uniref:AAA family ATPase n=1 Tax=Lachnospira eligens TaxID=39485 RepID=UPI002FE66540